MNYSAVGPPSQSGTGDPQTAFADALARARQIAAKINQPNAESETSSLKRPFDGSSENQPEAKKVAGINDFGGDMEAWSCENNDGHYGSSNGSIGAQLRAIADQQRASQAAQAAAAAASQINAKLGIQSSNGPPPHSPPHQPAMQGSYGGGHPGMGMVETEDYRVPDRMVGLIIGKGGEQIAAIQAETGCKVQFAPDSGGMPERPCTLTGTKESIMNAKEMISRIMAKGQGLPDPHAGGEGHSMVEVMVPGNKVGLVIGKGGETIKQLQEQAGVKMVMIQDSNIPTHHDKPLRITGDSSKCARAKEMVMDLIADKDGMGGGGGGGGGFNEYGSGGGRNMEFGGHFGARSERMEIPVPRNLVGVVIGKGGEMIKKIQSDSGAKVQFKLDDGEGPDRLCSVTGPPEKVQMAANMIHDLINNAMQRQGGGAGRGRGRGRHDERNDGGYNDRGPPGGGQGRFNNFGQDETTFTVPAEKCGLVIGKGGETIRDINGQSGAHVELSRQQNNNPGERVFKVQGNPDQIQHAVRLICEKAGLPPPPPNQGPGGGGGPPGGPPGQGPPGPGGPGGYGDQYGGQYGQQQYGQSPPAPQGPPQNYAPQGWGNAYQGWGQQQPNNDPSKPQGQDPNQAAWAAYYAQYYGQQPGGQPQQQPPQQQPQQQQQAQQPPNSAQPTLNPQTGQMDYSAAWAEYYRQQGMHYQAQAILQQAGQQQSGQPPQPPQ